MSFSIASLMKSHASEPGLQHGQADGTGQDPNFGYLPSDMAFLEEEDLDHLGVLYQKPETD